MFYANCLYPSTRRKLRSIFQKKELKTNSTKTENERKETERKSTNLVQGKGTIWASRKNGQIECCTLLFTYLFVLVPAKPRRLPGKEEADDRSSWNDKLESTYLHTTKGSVEQIW